ncbi:MAG: LysE family translocator [Pseudomonadota bacterium]
MSLELYLAFVAATALLILTPGPMVAFVIGSTLSRGLSHGLAAIAGSTLASAVHLGVVAFGLTAVLTLSGEAFFWLKWIGVAYLAYLGIRALREPAEGLEADARGASFSLRRTFLEGFFVNLTNPKGLLFHGAFLPLFISPAAPAGPQLALLAATFLVVGASLDTLWALSAARARPALARLGRWRGRITGGVLLTAATGLALARK